MDEGTVTLYVGETRASAEDEWEESVYFEGTPDELDNVYESVLMQLSDIDLAGDLVAVSYEDGVLYTEFNNGSAKRVRLATN